MPPKQRANAAGPVTRAIAGRILLLRRGCGLKQEELAEAVAKLLGKELTKFTVSAIERGKRLVDVEELYAFAAVLGVPVVELLPAENPYAYATEDKS